MRCDRVKQCPGGEDELHCPTHNVCPKGEIACSLRPKYCYKPQERCDGNFQCLFGEDEVGCVPGCELTRISCSNGEGCYEPGQRCDSRTDCTDESDEAGCPAELCAAMPDKRQCRNRRCLAARLWCDGSDDCGDASDEEACLQNSVITAAMMGALVGGLFLVLAVGYTIRYYGQRPPIAHSHLASQLRLRHSVSLPAHMDEEFLCREPPPAYSVAVADVRLPHAAAGGRRLHSGTSGRGGRPLLSVRRLPVHAPKPSSPVQHTGAPANSAHSQNAETAPPAPNNSYNCSDDTVQLIGA
ncbi:hypothetical protein LSTR_LSTR010371 [Laodelphax striatellus]|uniref:Uncharacterized protein n=1 Tax=Laodelphax striatellus TaxID=195883 RepID=A0A482WK14_LAOST|nr:hypothetical protein LSTR_LSTR010371 [Laodelphax striatellus]